MQKQEEESENDYLAKGNLFRLDLASSKSWMNVLWVLRATRVVRLAHGLPLHPVTGGNLSDVMMAIKYEIDNMNPNLNMVAVSSGISARVRPRDNTKAPL